MDLKASKRLIEELMKMNKNVEEQNIALEMEVKASQKIIRKLKLDNDLLKEYEEAIKEKDEQIRTFQKGKVIAENAIKNLQHERNLQGNVLDNAQKILKEKEQLIVEKDSLEQEIIEIQKENQLKEEKLESIKVEMGLLENKMLECKESKIEVKEKNVQKETNEMEKVSFVGCKFCRKSFQTNTDLKEHKKSEHARSILEARIWEMESKLTSEKLQLSCKLALLKKKDDADVGVCFCRSFCRIFHAKHNWKRSESDGIFQKMRDSRISFLQHM